jgi:competence protein ComEC
LTKVNSFDIRNIPVYLRKAIDERIKALHDKNTSGFLRGILLADRSDISGEIKESFINSGIIHLLAVSGLHVGYIVLIFYLLSARFNVHLRYLTVFLGILFFLTITGVPISAIRASLMAIILLTANYFDRGYKPVNSLFIAVLIILVYDPSEMYTAGFQLSVSSVFSILYFYPLFRDWLKLKGMKNRYLMYFLLFISISIFAQLGTLPFTVAYFRKISIVSFLTNMAAIPVAGIIIANSFVTLLVSLFSINTAFLFASVSNFLTGLLFMTGNFSGNLNFSYISISGFNLLNGLLYIVIIFTGLTYIFKEHPLKMKIVVCLLICANIVLVFAMSEKHILEDGKLSVLTIDVGQGDSFLIKFPSGKTALIDAGNATEIYDCGKQTIKPLLEYCGIKKLDYIFISHIDADHYKGVHSLIEKGLTDTVYVPYVDKRVEKEVNFCNFLTKHKSVIRNYEKTEIKLENSRIYFLMCSKISNFDNNNRSGIIKICFGNTSALFMGDADIEAEKELIIEFKTFLDSDVLKVGHHGSKHGTGQPFLQWVTPEFSIISTGKNNPHNHPAPEVIENLKIAGSRICRTDKEGAVLLVSDGERFKKVNWRDF